MNDVGIWEKKVPSRGDTKCKGPEVGACAGRFKEKQGGFAVVWSNQSRRHEVVRGKLREVMGVGATLQVTWDLCLLL